MTKNIDVKQREWAVASRGSKLYSEYFSTCVAFAGVERQTGVVFLCHFDSPVSVLAFDDLVEHLKKHVKDLSNFELYTAASVSPWVWLCLIVLSAIISAFSLPGGWGESISQDLLSIALMIGTFYSSAKCFLLHKLSQSKDFKRKPKHLGYYYGFRYEVTVDVDTEASPCAKTYRGKGREEDFKFSFRWYEFRLWFTKATKSQNSD